MTLIGSALRLTPIEQTKKMQLMGASKSTGTLTKDARFNVQMEKRRAQREQKIMERRGLNFVTEHHEELVA